MFNMTLFKREFKANYKIIFIFIAVISMYESMIIAMFNPELGKSLSMMAESMPELFKAFGMGSVGGTLIEFISNYLYGFILLVFPTVFIVLITNRLVTKYIDRGSMAYLLASPHTRKNIISTQAYFSIFGIKILVIYATILGIVLGQLMFPGDLDIGKFIILNIGLLGLLLFIASVCFFSACYFNDAKYSLGAGAGLVIAFVLMQMISQVGDKFKFVKYLTPLTLFDVKGLIAGNSNAYLLLVVLYIGALLLFYLGISIFCKKDLSV